MNTLKVNKKDTLNRLEYFILRILKNGQKYKYLRLLKNNFILFSKYCYINRLNVPTYNYLSNSMLNKSSVEFNSHDYTFIIKRIYKKKKWRKYINVTRLMFNHSKEKELYKLLYYILHKLRIRTIQLRLFYLTYIFNFRFFRKINIYKKLKRYYFMQLKNQRKSRSIFFKKKLFYGQHIFFLKKLSTTDYNWNTQLYTQKKNSLKLKFVGKLKRNLLFRYYFYLSVKRHNCGNNFIKKKVIKVVNLNKIQKVGQKKKKDYIRGLNLKGNFLKRKYLLASNFRYSKRNFFYKRYLNKKYI